VVGWALNGKSNQKRSLCLFGWIGSPQVSCDAGNKWPKSWRSLVSRFTNLTPSWG
jgi:hypothetical protein